MTENGMEDGLNQNSLYACKKSGNTKRMIKNARIFLISVLASNSYSLHSERNAMLTCNITNSKYVISLLFLVFHRNVI